MSVSICFLLGNVDVLFQIQLQGLAMILLIFLLLTAPVRCSSMLRKWKTPGKKSSLHDLCSTNSHGLLHCTEALLLPVCSIAMLAGSYLWKSPLGSRLSGLRTCVLPSFQFCYVSVMTGWKEQKSLYSKK